MAHHAQGGTRRRQEASRVADTDTIAAIATPPGRGGVGIVRVSGPAVPAVARKLLGALPPPRRAHFTAFADTAGEVVDRGLALYFPAPSSFTGEHVLELHGHGGPVIMDALLQVVLDAGVRPAGPGEFSERAFLNGKLDLAQAEAVADLIDAASREAATAAMRSLQGEFSRRVAELATRLAALRTFVEAAIDFPDEEADFLAEGDIVARIDDWLAQFDILHAEVRQGVIMQEGITVVIAGRPNVGKSSLLNRLAGDDTAIVTDIPGTTRDVLRTQLQIDGLPITVIDTAGLRESADPVEREGVRRAREAITCADRVLLVVDDRDGVGEGDRQLLATLPPGPGVTVIYNKCDLTGNESGVGGGARPWIRLSARTGAGLQELRDHLKACVGYHSADSGAFSARRRHLDALARTRAGVEHGRAQIVEARAGELLAEELRLAHRALGEIVGEYTTEDLLGSIFSTFCIGK